MRKNAKGAEEKKRSQETKKMEFMETKFNENDEKESLWKKNTQKPTKNGEKPKYVVTKGNKHDTMTMKIKLCTERSWALQDMIASIAYIPRSHKRSESAKRCVYFQAPQVRTLERPDGNPVKNKWKINRQRDIPLFVIS